ncbi:MAG: hypothetical protein LBG27_08760 [Spirochaetaceae bacterium]|jgi:hypothetical protein|nr:hypothetical protein [Spirochaetaceae bacterium]
MKKITLLLCLFAVPGIFAQTGDPADPSDGLPRGYRTISLGIGIEELKEALRRDTEAYLFREDRDVYHVPLRDENYVETTGRGFIKRGFFQLKDSSLFVISLELNPDRIDYYSVFTAFRDRYGEPESIDPQKATWASEAVRVSIERPLTVKYIDRAVFDAINAEAGISDETVLRDNFLRDF